MPFFPLAPFFFCSSQFVHNGFVHNGKEKGCMEEIVGGDDDTAGAAFDADALRYVCAEHICTGLDCRDL